MLVTLAFNIDTHYDTDSPLTSNTDRAWKLLISWEISVRRFEARISLVSSVCSHHLSSVLSRLTSRASSGTSRFSLHTVSGTGKQTDKGSTRFSSSTCCSCSFTEVSLMLEWYQNFRLYHKILVCKIFKWIIMNMSQMGLTLSVVDFRRKTGSSFRKIHYILIIVCNFITHWAISP